MCLIPILLNLHYHSRHKFIYALISIYIIASVSFFSNKSDLKWKFSSLCSRHRIIIDAGKLPILSLLIHQKKISQTLYFSLLSSARRTRTGIISLLYDFLLLYFVWFLRKRKKRNSWQHAWTLCFIHGFFCVSKQKLTVF
jgi:hypothetical protein